MTKRDEIKKSYVVKDILQLSLYDLSRISVTVSPSPYEDDDNYRMEVAGPQGLIGRQGQRLVMELRAENLFSAWEEACKLLDNVYGHQYILIDTAEDIYEKVYGK